MKKVLFVCLGNICRSPLGEGILQDIIQREGLDWEVDSAGTSGFHAGDQPDSRSIEIARNRGIDIQEQTSRKFVKKDFQIFDHILVMDNSNFSNVLDMAGSKIDEAKVETLLSYGHSDLSEVPDPYIVGGFDFVFDLIQDAVEDFVTKNNN